MPSLEEIARIVQAIASHWSEENALGSRFRSQEARAFFHTRDVAATLGLANSGMRVSEWFRVRLQDLDIQERTINLGQPTTAYLVWDTWRWTT